MKKKWIILGIVLLAIIIGIIVFVVSINKGKTPITANQFKSIMEDKGFTVTDYTYQFAEYGDILEKCYAANNGNYQIEFFSLSSI